MAKIYIVKWGTWNYEEQDYSCSYFGSRKSALRFALSLRREKGECYEDGWYGNEFYELPFSSCYKFEDGRRCVTWSKGYYCGVSISVSEEELLP